MKDKGAVGSDDDFKRVLDYLAKNFPASVSGGLSIANVGGKDGCPTFAKAYVGRK